MMITKMDNENNYYISYEDEESMEEVIDDEYSNDTRDSEKDELESKFSKKSKKNKSIVEKYTTNMTNFLKSDISEPLDPGLHVQSRFRHDVTEPGRALRAGDAACFRGDETQPLEAAAIPSMAETLPRPAAAPAC